MRYRTALRPEKQCKVTHFFAILQIKECKWRQIGGRSKEGRRGEREAAAARGSAAAVVFLYNDAAVPMISTKCYLSVHMCFKTCVGKTGAKRGDYFSASFTASLGTMVSWKV